MAYRLVLLLNLQNRKVEPMLQHQFMTQPNSNIPFIANQLVTFTNENLLSGLGGAIDIDTPLLELGILDSLAMISLMTFIQSEFGVHIPDESVIPEHFENLETIAVLVDELRAEREKLPSEAKSGGPLREAVRILEGAGIERQVVKLDDGQQMHLLRVAGGTPTWVLLPGLGNPSTSWGTMLRSLMDDNEAIALDFAGFGLSSSDKERPNYVDHLQATLEVLEKVAEPPFVLVGSSAGAMIATEIARQRPEWVHALVVTGFGLISDVDAWWQRLVGLSNSPEQFLAAAYYRPPTLTNVLEALIDDVLSRTAYHSFLEGGGFAAMRATFDKLNVPTLFVAGQNDEIIPPSAVMAAADRVPGAQLKWLARCGHFPPAEQPEELLYVIRNFLKKLS